MSFRWMIRILKIFKSWHVQGGGDRCMDAPSPLKLKIGKAARKKMNRLYEALPETCNNGGGTIDENFYDS